MTDRFLYHAPGLTSPAADAAAVTPSDDTDLAFITRGLYVGGAGDVAVIMAGGETITFADVPAGSVLPLRVRRVLLTGTSATGIIALS